MRWDETERHINGRAAENTLRLATLRAISRNPAAPAVAVDDIEWGFAIVHRSIAIISDGISRHMAASPAEALRNAVKEALRDKPNGLAYSLLLQRQGIRKADNRLLKDALRWLLDAQEIIDVSGNHEPGKGSRFRLRE
ncbi:hypothetical protein [Chelatococcus asaccharovorans]|uniref:hypothetical protein n=1 Tax=Chelatococcus asaccharovorans TaxID=28210 RepID=UPI000D76EB04|nr:hypothetical protein [Chelatococcus asaccharovorans]MBS7702653.1 hypothetical protein [Chelatococcus asaccharovorans]